MFQVKEINKAPFEDAERVFETNHPELRYAVASQRAVGFYEALKDYNETRLPLGRLVRGRETRRSRGIHPTGDRKGRGVGGRVIPILFEQV